jgi:hypothetical protein
MPSLESMFKENEPQPDCTHIETNQSLTAGVDRRTKGGQPLRAAIVVVDTRVQSRLGAIDAREAGGN